MYVCMCVCVCMCVHGCVCVCVYLPIIGDISGDSSNRGQRDGIRVQSPTHTHGLPVQILHVQDSWLIWGRGEERRRGGGGGGGGIQWQEGNLFGFPPQY